MPGNTLDTVSADQLCAEIKRRLSYTPQTVEQTNIKIYQEILKRCNLQMREYLSTNPVDEFLHSEGIEPDLQRLSKLCAVVDKKTTKSHLVAINRITELIEYLTDLPWKGPVIPHKSYKGNDKIAKMLIKRQAMKYVKYAFVGEMFDDAATKFSDAVDIIGLARSIYTADLKAAANKMSLLDTIIREDIPASAWTWMQKNL